MCGALVLNVKSTTTKPSASSYGEVPLAWGFSARPSTSSLPTALRPDFSSFFFAPGLNKLKLAPEFPLSPYLGR
jgi:hypothetical protein